MEKGPSVTVVKKTTVRRRSSEKKKAIKSGKEKVQVHVSKKERIVRPRSSRTQNKKKETKKRQAFSKESGDKEDNKNSRPDADGHSSKGKYNHAALYGKVYGNR